MRTIRVSNGQSLQDIALQECGSVTADLHIALRNNIPLTKRLTNGQILDLPPVINLKVVEYFRARSLQPATDIVAPATGIGNTTIGVNLSIPDNQIS